MHFELRRLWGSGACVKKSKNLVKILPTLIDDPPSQVYPGCPSVINGLDAIEHNGPLCGRDRHKEIECGRAETVAHQKGAQEAKP